MVTKEAEILQKAYEAGRDLEKTYGSCARCVVAALQETVDFVPHSDDAVMAASALDGRATTSRLANCGAFTGAGIVIGLLCGTNRENFHTRPELANKLMLEVTAKFEAEYGSVLCKDIREKVNQDCPEVVGKAARWTAETLLKQFGSAPT